jgi:putative hemolysin
VILILSFLLAFLTILSGFFSTTETAFFSLPGSRVHAWRHSSIPSRQLVARLLAKSHYLLVLIFMLDSIADIFLQNVASDLFDRFGGGWLLKVGVPLFLILVFGEFLPKYLGMIWNETFALYAAPLFVFLERFTSPLQKFITFVAETFSGFLFYFLKQEPPLTQKELEIAIRTCESSKILSSEEASLITHTLHLEKKLARELMVPRSAMPTLKKSPLTYSYLKNIVATTKNTPLLIVDETTDRPLGVLSDKSVRYIDSVETLLQESAKDVFFIPEVMPTRRLLLEFFARGALIACVIDEHGSLSGYIEWNQLLQKMLGFPQKRGTVLPTSLRAKQKSITLPGTTPLTTVNALFDTALVSEHHSTTLGGYLTELFDSIPPAGTSFTTDELFFRVLSANPTMVLQVYIQKNAKPLPPTITGDVV